jgi:DNA-binding NarL/FixJ family response regulator
MMISAIMFEDDRQFRRSFQEYFEDSDKVFLAAAFADAENAVAQVKRHKPDVVIMDIQMPGINGLEALRLIKAASPDTHVMMLTTFDDEEKIFAAICSGASGYALKSEQLDRLEKAMGDVSEGGGFMSPSIAAKVMRMFQNQLVRKQPEYADLTDRQKDVLQAMVNGLNRKMIATELKIGYDTVGDHIKEIYRKLHVNSASEAVREAILRKIV